MNNNHHTIVSGSFSEQADELQELIIPSFGTVEVYRYSFE